MRAKNRKGTTNKADKGEMTLVGHLTELRRRIILSLVFVLLGSIVGYWWYGNNFFHVPPLGEILRGPYCSLPSDLRADFSTNGECKLLATKPFDMFMLRFKIGLLAGIVISSPLWLSQLWAFIAPGLYKTEKVFALTIAAISSLLFIAGALTAYFVLEQGLDFLLGVGRDFQIAAINGSDYYNIVRNFILLFGASFEIPLMVGVLNYFGILKYSAIKGKRRLVWVGTSIVGAIFSPGQEVISMLVLTFCLILLLEVSFLFCRLNDKKKARAL